MKHINKNKGRTKNRDKRIRKPIHYSIKNKGGAQLETREMNESHEPDSINNEYVEALSNNNNYENAKHESGYKKGVLIGVELSHGIEKCVDNIDEQFNTMSNANRGKIQFNYHGVNIGYVTFDHIKKDKYNRFEIETIFVNHHERDKGYGKKLLKIMIIYAFDKLHSKQIILQDQTGDKLFNPSRKINNMYRKSKFKPLTSSFRKNMKRLTVENYNKKRKKIFGYLNQTRSHRTNSE